ncbi:MAG: hypothetical protein ABW328_16520 [Ilumatobacteraceae bacterium]
MNVQSVSHGRLGSFHSTRFGVVFSLFASPLFAELISSYLAGTGDLVASVGVRRG